MARHYYGITRSPEYLAHYGVKGMKWGVRKAIKKGDSKALAKHYRKATQKLEKLKQKTNLDHASNVQLAGRALGRGAGALLGVQTGLIGALAANDVARRGTRALSGVAPMAGFLAGAPAAAAAVGGAAYLKGKHRMSSKGHAKNVQKVHEFANAAKEAFKGTAYEKDINDQSRFNDEYKLVDVGRNKKTGQMEARTIAKIKGSHLTSDYNGKDKQCFLNMAKAHIKPVDNNGIHIRSLETDADSSQVSRDPMSFAYNVNALLPKSQRKKMSVSDSSTAAYYDSLGKVDNSDYYYQEAQRNRKKKRKG